MKHENEKREHVRHWILYQLGYPYWTVCSNDTVDRGLGKRIKIAIRTAQEVRFQKESAISVVFEFAHIQLHAQIGCLKVEWDHLATGIPEDLHINKKTNNIGLIEKWDQSWQLPVAYSYLNQHVHHVDIYGSIASYCNWSYFDYIKQDWRTAIIFGLLKRVTWNDRDDYYLTNSIASCRK